MLKALFDSTEKINNVFFGVILSRPLFVCHKLKFSLSLPPLCLCLSLPFRAVAREAGRIRSLAADEGHGEKSGIAHK